MAGTLERTDANSHMTTEEGAVCRIANRERRDVRKAMRFQEIHGCRRGGSDRCRHRLARNDTAGADSQSSSNARYNAFNTFASSSMRNLWLTRCSAAADQRRNMSGVASASSTAAYSWPTSPGGTRRPVSPSTTSSSKTPAVVARTGTPQAIASSGVTPNPSHRCGATNMSSTRYQSGMSAVGTSGRNRSRSSSPLCATFSRRCCIKRRWRPVARPMTRAVTSVRRGSNSSIASTNTSVPFWCRIRP